MIRNATFNRRMLATAVIGALALMPLSQPALGATTLEKQLRTKINAYRTSKGKATLKMKDVLVDKAHAQAEKMAEEGELSHSTGTQLTRYANAAGCDTGTPPIAENIAVASTLDGLMQEWKDSTPHRKAMLSKKWERIGTGVVEDDGTLWGVVLFCSTK